MDINHLVFFRPFLFTFEVILFACYGRCSRSLPSLSLFVRSVRFGQLCVLRFLFGFV